MHPELSELGWSPDRQRELEALGAHLIPARISAVELSELWLAGCEVERATITGKLRRAGGTPVTGDWVALESGRIAHVLERRTTLARRAADETGREQLVCANVDKVLIVTAVGADFSARRVERYLALTYEGGAQPVVVLNKSDLEQDPAASIDELRASAPLVPVVMTSALRADGLDELLRHVQAGETIAIVGSSGVGKSSLTNRLLGEERQEVREIRAGDDKGRHTTSRRELLRAPSGVLIIDTPGLRKVGLTALDDGLDQAFTDVLAFAAECRFRDCTHAHEPKCAVRAAVERGELPGERLESYLELHGEVSFETRRRRKRQQSKAYRVWKKLHRPE